MAFTESSGKLRRSKEQVAEHGLGAFAPTIRWI